jgi:glucose/mannose-6-phosphate isomerase
VIVASYSGNTEETLSMFEDARRRGSKLVAISSGGRLMELSQAYSVPHCKVPSGMVPRASLGHVLGALLGVVERAGIAAPSEEVESSRRTLAQIATTCGADTATCDNPAKQLAHELFGNVPVVIGYGLSAPVGKRWANQLSENAKILAFHSTLPEMDHNEIVGWMSDGRSQGFSPVFLEHDVAGESMVRRLNETKAMLSDRARVHCVCAQGDGMLPKMLSLVLFGDFVSAYLGILRNEDPSSTEPIEQLKRNLSKKST